MSLNPQQASAVHWIDSPLLVLAGAGSGKTRVITEKIVYLVQQQQIPPQFIYAVTFTNKASREMTERLKQQLDAKQANRVHISTFHRLGLDILRQEHEHTRLNPNFSVLDGTDVKTLLKDILHQQVDQEGLNRIQWRISHWKNQGLSPEQVVMEEPGDEQAQLAYQMYQQQCHAYNAVDFDDLLLLPAQLFTAHPLRRLHWQKKVQYLLVDEVQDTNPIQYQLMHHLVGDGLFTAVGDDDQSIYAWRGADAQNMANLSQHYPELKVIKLEQNYRSNNTILQCANGVITHNPQIYPKQLWSELGQGDLVRILSCDDEQMEAERVVFDLDASRIKRQNHFRDYAILYRSNYQSLRFEQQLRQANIPYVLSGGQSLFDRTEIKDIMAYLRLLTNPDDNTAFLRIVNIPRREIGATSLEVLSSYANQRQISFFDAIIEHGFSQQASPRLVNKLRQFYDFIHNAMRASYDLQDDEAAQFLRQFIEELGYFDWIMDQATNPKQAEKRIENLMGFVDWVHKLLLKDDGRTLEKVVQNLSLIDRLDHQDSDEVQNQVTLMTLHAAKGLEFPHVYLTGVEEEILPHKNSMDDEVGVQEERRLMYVGITRAQRSLTLSYCKKRRQYGEMLSKTPSRFLQELPDQCVSWPSKPGAQSADKAQQKQQASQHLTDLLASLSD